MQGSENNLSYILIGASAEPSPVKKAVAQVNIRPMSVSKSLENLATASSREYLDALGFALILFHAFKCDVR